MLATTQGRVIGMLVARWRARSESNMPIDATGVMPDGRQFEGPAGLRTVLLQAPDQFVTTVTEKLLTYALGRGVDYFDAPTIRDIVHSTPFQMRKSQ